MEQTVRAWRKIRKFLSGVFFWFLLTLASYVALLFENTIEQRYSSLPWWRDFYDVTSVFLTGGLISFFFYFLVVAVPEKRKRRIIKANLQNLYKDIKRDIAYQIILASKNGGRTDLSADSETIERVLTIKGFRELFEGGGEGNEGFYAFRNHMSGDAPEFRSIILSLQALSKQIDYILHNYQILDDRAFNFFKRLELVLLSLEKNGTGYEEEKALSRFIWDIFGGASWIEGPHDHDPIQKTIDGI